MRSLDDWDPHKTTTKKNSEPLSFLFPWQTWWYVIFLNRPSPWRSSWPPCCSSGRRESASTVPPSFWTPSYPSGQKRQLGPLSVENGTVRIQLGSNPHTIIQYYHHKPCSIADSGCLSQIRIFSIPHSGSRVKKIPGSRIRIKELKYFNPKKCF